MIYISKAKTTDPNWLEIEGMRNHIAKKIAPCFGVNPQVIEVRLDHEGIWPVDMNINTMIRTTINNHAQRIRITSTIRTNPY